MPFFSIVIPTFNRGHLISKTIESVLNQTFNDWELIIVDDGGTDETQAVIEAFNNPKIHYYWKTNGERGAARNYGTKKAKGQYVFFLDSDDLIYPNHLKHAHKQLVKLALPAFFHSRYETVFPEKTESAPALNQAKIWSEIQKQNKFACQFFLKHDIALDIPFSENRQLKIGEDWLVILKVGKQYPLHISNEIHAGIVQHAERSMHMASFETILTSRDLILTELKSSDRKLQKNIYFEFTSLAALSAAIQNAPLQAYALLLKAFIKKPIRLLSQRRTLATLKHIFF